jgi:hypothetical protein
MHIIIQDIKDFLNWWKQFLFTKRHAFKLKLAMKLADMKQQAFNKQYFVILSPNDKLVSINNKEIERLKRTRRYTESQLKKISKALAGGINDLDFNGLTEDEIKAVKLRYRSENDKKLIALRRLKLLDKNLDGIKLRKTCFYYTPISKNNTMSKEELKDARERYFTYAKKYLR